MNRSYYLSHRKWAKPENDFSQNSPPHSLVGSEVPPLDLMGKRVVVIEDEAITQLQLRKTLTRSGVVVAGAAGTGMDGVHVSLAQRPDIILMDINMPGEIDGLEATRRILETFSTCVILLTAYDTEYHRGIAEQVGASGYIIKPVLASSLIPQIQSAYAEYQRKNPKAIH